MLRTILAGLLAVAVAVTATPADAAKRVKRPARKTVKKAVRPSITDFEREAWGGGATKKVVRKQVKKAPAKKGEEVKATVTLSGKPKPAPTVKLSDPAKTAKTEPKPEEKKPDAVAADTETKSEEEIEKAAREQKDPSKAIATYNQLLQRNPNYQYSGDVYRNMYQLSQRNGADTLTQLQFAGKAAQALEQGRSRGPVNPQEVQKLNRAADDLINRWIEETTRQILSEKGKR